MPNTTLGITEIDAVRASNDFREVGTMNPNIRSLIAYNTDSKLIKTIRTNGVLIAQVTPRGGLISGQSSIMYLDGNNWQDAELKSDDSIHINWPSSYYKTGWWGEPGKNKKNSKYTRKISELDYVFSKARSYFLDSKIIDLKMESMKGIFSGDKNLYLHADISSDIQDAIYFAKKYDVKNIVIVGGEDAFGAKKILTKYNIPVILSRVHRLPNSQDSHIHQPFTQAKKLQDANILFCLSYEGDMEAMGARNLPFTAGTTVAYGQEYEKAVQSITLSAKILKIDHKLAQYQKAKTMFLLVMEML